MKVWIPADLNQDDFKWTEEPVTGMVLLDAKNDSTGKAIDRDEFYFVGKHNVSGKLAIIHVPDYSPNQTELT